MVKKAKKAKKAKQSNNTTKTVKKKATKKRAAGKKTAHRMTPEMHSIAFQDLVANAHKFEKSPLCYREYPDGSAQVCKLLPDGSYGDCESYFLRPVPGPRCG
jgi:hypothetical protein